MFHSDSDREFVALLTDAQAGLLSFLLGILGNIHDARDALQETNLVLLRKMSEFEVGTNFGAWSRSCARFVALSQLRDRKRDPHVFDDQVFELLADEAPPARDPDEMLTALRGCLSELPPGQLELIQHRYHSQTPLRTLATKMGKSEDALKMMLLRTRKWLRTCIRTKLTPAL